MIEIRHRHANAVLYKSETATTLKAALAEAVKAGADLAGAYLADANLADADLAGARSVPRGTEAKDPPEPYVRAATPEQRRAREQAQAERYRKRNPDVPVIERLDAKILAAVEGPAAIGALEMGQWHTCETTHCRAGWAITLAGEAGRALEAKYGPHGAGRMIYLASTGHAPHFFASNTRALEDLRERAAGDPAAAKETP